MGLATLLIPLGSGPGAAHPLGNFTINHYTGIRVSPDSVLVDRVIDRAEIPTFQARAAMDVDGDGAVSDAEATDWREAACASDSEQLHIAAGAAPLALRVDASALGFPMGQGALTTRLVCRYSVPLPAAVTTAAMTFRVEDRADETRIGWREIVVSGDATTIRDGDALAASVSARLTSYPSDLLATPADQRVATWSAVVGGPSLPPLETPELLSSGSSTLAAVPGGIAELGADVAGLFQARELTLGVIVLSLLAAAGLGALHAASPGHGKTVMAAYLVGSRGTSRQALGLGLTVTLSHTLGVLALAGLTLAASSVIAPERLYPILGGVSGSIVILIAGWLLIGRLRIARRDRAERAHRRQHHPDLALEHHHGSGDDHHHGTGDDHDHGAGHGHHHHPHGPDEAHHHVAAHTHDHDHEAPSDDGWHSHGGIRHTHLPPRDGGLSVRGLFALGLAGGMVPSVSAIILLLGSIAMGRPAYGIALTVAFGVGMATVLVGVGVVLVRARGLLERLPSGPARMRVGRILPAITPAVMLVAGLLITSQAVLALR
jgi:ABC-type nickel/cobalt efflux system permease component RcnA